MVLSTVAPLGHPGPPWALRSLGKKATSWMLNAEEVGSRSKHQSMALSLLETLGVSLAEARLVGGCRMGKHAESIWEWLGFSCQIRLFEGKEVRCSCR